MRILNYFKCREVQFFFVLILCVLWFTLTYTHAQDDAAPLVVLNESEQLIPTLNKMGYQKFSIDIIEQSFIDYIVTESLSSNNVQAIELGSGYGHVTIEAIKQGANKVYANDIDAGHLEVLKANLPDQYHRHLTLVPGAFPDDLDFPENYFDAVLIARVLHFFTGDEIDKGLQKIKQWLKPGGKLFVTVETPYLGNWQQFIPEYEERKATGEKWPGLITMPKKYEQNRTVNLPDIMHHLDDDILGRALLDAGLEIEFITLIDRKSVFPEDMLYDGRESVGAIAIKPFTT